MAGPLLDIIPIPTRPAIPIHLGWLQTGTDPIQPIRGASQLNLPYSWILRMPGIPAAAAHRRKKETQGGKNSGS